MESGALCVMIDLEKTRQMLLVDNLDFLVDISITQVLVLVPVLGECTCVSIFISYNYYSLRLI